MLYKTSTKGTIDPEGLLTILYAYSKCRTQGNGQRRLIHRKITTINIKLYQRNFYIYFCTIRSTAIRAIFWKNSDLQSFSCLHRQNKLEVLASTFSEGSMSSFKSITWTLITEMMALWQLKIWASRSVGNISMNVQAKFRWAAYYESLRDF